MNITSLIPFIYAKLFLFILVVTRLSAFFSTFIVFRRDFVNARIIVSLSVVLALYIVMSTSKPPVSYDLLSLAMLLQELFQFMLGFLAGFILNIVFEVFVSFGQIVSTQIGLSLASVIDPTFGSVTSLSQFYVYTIVLIFLFLNGHLMVIKTVMDSFAILPVGQLAFPSQLLMTVLHYAGVIFSGSISLSMTIIVAVLITNFALALMARFAPQFNLFSIGVNMTLILGLVCIYAMFDMFTVKGADFLNESMQFLQTSLGKLK